MKRKVVFIGILITAIVVFVFVFQSQSIPVKEYTVKSGAIQEFVESNGIVELENKKTIYSTIDGVIKDVMINEGDAVKSGEKLARINNDDLSNSIKISRTTYNSEVAKYEDLINSVKPEQIKQAEAQLEQARLTLENAKEDYNNKNEQYEKSLELYKNAAISKTELEDKELSRKVSKYNVDNAEQSYKIEEYQLQLLKNGPSEKSIKVSQASVEQSKLNIKNLEEKLLKLSVTSDINGIVLTKFIDLDSLVNIGSPLFEIGDYNSAYIKVYVPNDEIGKIAIGQYAIISDGVLDKKEIKGEVTYISPKAESSISSLGMERQQIMIKIKLNDNNTEFKPGYEFKVKIITKEKNPIIFIPKKSIFTKESKECVFVVRNGKLEIAAIEKGIGNKDFVEIISGISEGDIIVEELDNGLKEGLKISSYQ